MRRRALAILLVVLVAIGVLVWLFNQGGDSGVVPPPSSPSVGPGGGGSSGSGSGSGGDSGVPAGWSPSSLDGALDVYGGDVLTRVLWANMSDFNVSDPVVRGYLEWLGTALSTSPGVVAGVLSPARGSYAYDIGVGRVTLPNGAPGFWVDGWLYTQNPPSPPPEEGVVRIGVVVIPNWSVALIVTAYYDGEGLNIVIHSRPYNASRFWEVVTPRAKALTGIGGLPTRILYRESIPVTGNPALVLQDGTRVPIKHVAILVEEPMYVANVSDMNLGYDWDLSNGEWAYFAVLARPAYGLALHLALGPDASLKDAYIQYTLKLVDSLARYHKYYMNPLPSIGIKTLGVGFPTPLGLRTGSAICSYYSQGNTLFATLVLGGIADSHGAIDHQIALLVVPSSIWSANLPSLQSPYGSGGPFRGPIQLTFDADGDGVNDTGYVLDNIAPNVRGYDWIINTLLIHLDPIYNLEEAGSAYEGDYIVVYGDGWQNFNIFGRSNKSLTLIARAYYSGLLGYVNGLPDWLQPPWHPLLYEEIYRYRPPHTDPMLNLTREQVMAMGGLFVRMSVEGYNISADDFKIYSPIPDAPIINVTVPNEIPAQHVNLVESNESEDGSSGGGSGGTTPPPTNNVIEADVYLAPVYTTMETRWGTLPVFDRYEGSVVVSVLGSEVNVSVKVWAGRVEVLVSSGSSWDVWSSSLDGFPDELTFTAFYGTQTYRIHLHYPPIPALNASINVELVPDHNQSIGYPNGTLVNVTFYKVNQTITVGNATIIIYGDVSRLWTTLFIEIYGVPPTNTTLNITAPSNLTINPSLNTGARIQATIQIPPNDTPQGPILTPPGTTITITIQPYNLTITLTIP